MVKKKNITATIEKYLRNYACVDTKKYADEFLKKNKTKTPAPTEQPHYSHVLIIPAYNENTAFVRRLVMQDFEGVKKLLAIVIINQPRSTPSFTRLNQRLSDYIQSLTLNKSIQFLVIEAFVATKHGVGFARKLGCDVALQLMASHHIKNSWLYCSDADATLPSNYFTPLLNENYSALVYDFRHQYDQEDHELNWAQKCIENATQAYEKSLYYYRDCLASAGSPYAYSTIGSCIAAHPEYYAQARGFPLKNAGEDFYLLNKLNKLKPVKPVAIKILLKPRISQRVPFGTGPAVSKRLYSAALEYHPECFNALKIWLAAIPQLNTQNTLSIERLQLELSLPNDIKEGLRNIGIATLLEHIQKQAKNETQVQRMCFEWFDAFKTLKFIHHLTEHFYPKVPLEETGRKAPVTPARNND